MATEANNVQKEESVSPLSETDTGKLQGLAEGICSLVWWTFNGTKITPAELRTRVQAAGFSPDTVKDIDPVSAIRSSCRDFSVRAGKQKVMEAVIAEDTPTEMRINLLKLEKQGRKVAKLPVDVLVWDKQNNAWTENGNHAEAPRLLAMVADRMVHLDGNAVRDYLVQPALSASKVFTLRRGMYVVPHASAEPLAKAQAALSDLESFNLRIASVGRNAGWEEPMQEAAKHSMRDELEELQEQIENWKTSAHRVRSDTQLTVMQRFSELRERCQIYMDALEVSFEDLQDEVNDMEAMANQVIDMKESERASASPKPKKTYASAFRETLAAMHIDQLNMLWDAFCEGDAPTELAELVEGIAQSQEKPAEEPAAEEPATEE